MAILKPPARIKLLLASAAVMILAAPIAQAGPEHAPRGFPAADTNQDGIISKAEFMAVSGRRFMMMDHNQDGLLSSDEQRKMVARRHKDKRSKAVFDAIDNNHDGMISRAEFEAHMAKKDARMKKHRENAQIEHDRRVKGRADMPPDHDKMKRYMKDHGSMGHWKRFDANQDGLISRAEYDAGAEVMFERLDVNDDGQLSQGEGRHRKRPEPDNR